MLYPLSTLALGPLLLGQGRYVRRVTPRLPEPEGERQGVIGAGPALRLLILGDSAGSHYLPVAYSLAPAAMAADGFHPGRDAYGVWADQAGDRICELVPTTAR